ncbi:uncharacterized protein LOC134201693 [Bombyx mori]|uniref:uncharacterized protein LOC134201693 n=1 Tax=Bombyx mori TaxID=7091 RepID=UPI002ED5DA0E
MRSNIFSANELEQLRLEAVPASSLAPAEGRVSIASMQDLNVGGAVDTGYQPLAADGGADGIASQDNEQIRRILEEAILEVREMPLDARPRIPRIAQSHHSRNVVEAVNEMLLPYLENSSSLTDTNSILFGAAMAVCRYIGAKLQPNRQVTAADAQRVRDAEPAWKRRIERRISDARVLIGKLISFRTGNTRRESCDRIDLLKQKVAAWSKRIRRYSERVQRYRQNRLFVSDQRKFYRSLEQANVSAVTERPAGQEMVTFWRNLWSRPVEHVEGSWMQVIEDSCAGIPPMSPVTISKGDIKAAVCSSSHWKSPGCDGLQLYWLKSFRACHETLARQFQEALDTKVLPAFLTTGITHLIPKSESIADPAQYRPITCLPTTYKTLTSVLETKISHHIDSCRVLSGAQNGCRRGSRGTKELLLIDAVAGQQVKRNRRNFSAAWIDYKKAFGSVPHTWLKRVLELYKIDDTVRDFLGACMGQWSTMLSLSGVRLSAVEDRIKVNRGIFQGDCLIPLWFCLALNSPSSLREASRTGFQFRRGGSKVSHLFYMDDLKLYAPHAAGLRRLLDITCDFSSRIRMRLGVDKCAVLHVERGSIVSSDRLPVSDGINLRALSEGETYRYLGMSQNLGIDVAVVKQAACDVFCERLTKVCKSLLSGVNKTRATKEQQHAFEFLKEKLVTAPLLQYPNFSEPFNVTTDAKSYAVMALYATVAPNRILSLSRIVPEFILNLRHI